MLLSAAIEVRNQQDQSARFAVIAYDRNGREFEFSAKRFSSPVSSYICQLPKGLPVM